MSILIDQVNKDQLRKDLPDFGPGDTVRVGVRITEGNKERVQVFEGVVIRRRSGGINENFTVRRIATHGIGVERTFLINSPRIESIKVMRRGKVRRAALYYLRGLSGKEARIKEKRDFTTGGKGITQQQAKAAPVEAESMLDQDVDQSMDDTAQDTGREETTTNSTEKE